MSPNVNMLPYISSENHTPSKNSQWDNIQRVRDIGTFIPKKYVSITPFLHVSGNPLEQEAERF